MTDTKLWHPPLLLMLLALSACGSTVISCPPPTAGDKVYVIEQGWHAEIAIPVEQLGKNLGFFRNIFSGARVIMFGYGKKTFITAPPDTMSEYFLGPFPGPAVVQVVALNTTPLEAYPPEYVVTLALPPGGNALLTDYIWRDLSKDNSGKPVLVAPSTNPTGQFYASESEYNLFHTCNTWTADALHASGLPIVSDRVIFSGQVMARVNETAKAECRSIQ